MIKCSKCKKTMNDDVKECIHCGKNCLYENDVSMSEVIIALFILSSLISWIYYIVV